MNKQVMMYGALLLVIPFAFLLFLLSHQELFSSYIVLLDNIATILPLIFIPILSVILRFDMKTTYLITLTYLVGFQVVSIAIPSIVFYSSFDNGILRIVYQVFLSLIGLVLSLTAYFGYCLLIYKKQIPFLKILLLYCIGLISLSLIPPIYSIVVGVSMDFSLFLLSIKTSIFIEAMITIPIWYTYQYIHSKNAKIHPLFFYFGLGITCFMLSIFSSLTLSLTESLSAVPLYIVEQLKADSSYFLIYGVQGIILFVVFHTNKRLLTVIE